MFEYFVNEMYIGKNKDSFQLYLHKDWSFESPKGGMSNVLILISGKVRLIKGYKSYVLLGYGPHRVETLRMQWIVLGKISFLI